MRFGSIAIKLALFYWATVAGQQSRPPFWQADVGCEICLDGVCYGIQKLLNETILSIVEPVAIDRVENIMYYHYGHVIRSLNLNDQTTRDVKSGVGGAGLAVDQATRNLYFHSNAGREIFKFNPVTDQIDQIYNSTERRFIKHLYFHDKLYAIVNLKLHTLKEGKLELFEPLQNKTVYDNIVIDKKGDLYFGKGHTTYKLPAGSNALEKLNGTTHVVVSTDKDGVAYFTHAHKIMYRLDYSTNEIAEVGVFDSLAFSMYGPAAVYFDKYNNIVFINMMSKLNYLTRNAGRCRKRETTLYSSTIYQTIEKLS